MTKPLAGDVWRYDYLWRWQHDAHETEGAGRSRWSPSSQIRTVRQIFSSCRLPVVRPHMPLWVMIDEYNHDVLEGPFYFDPNGRLGSFSSAFRQKALRAFTQASRDRRTKAVLRRD